MRPTSSRVGNFLSSDKPQSTNDAAVVYEQQPQVRLPANLPSIKQNQHNTVDRDGRLGQQPPLSHRASLAKPAASSRRASQHHQHKASAPQNTVASQLNNNNGAHENNDDYLPLMMLNPPITLFEEADDRMYQKL